MKYCDGIGEIMGDMLLIYAGNTGNYQKVLCLFVGIADLLDSNSAECCVQEWRFRRGWCGWRWGRATLGAGWGLVVWWRWGSIVSALDLHAGWFYTQFTGCNFMGCDNLCTSNGILMLAPNIL